MPKKSKNGAAKRTYSAKTIKTLFALSGNQCAEPDCDAPIVKSATSESAAHVHGQIAHIYAVSEDGPRGKAGLTEEELNDPSNLILLCPNHHDIVDGQHETYPAATLQEWKRKHERQYAERLSRSVSGLGYAELELAARSLVSNPSDETSDELAILAPREKIKKNGLGNQSALLLSVGAAKSQEVAALFTKIAQLDPDFPERLRSGFVAHYKKARSDGLKGDDLFLEVYEWASGAKTDPARQAAGLCILSHLFILCDVFEK